MARRPKSIWEDKDSLLKASQSSKSIADAVRSLGLASNSGNRKQFKSYCSKYGIDLPVWDYSSGGGGAKKTLTNAEVFCNPSKERNGSRLKSILLRDYGYVDICDECGLGPEWNGKPIVLQLDHIDGNRLNNEIKNLRILCPNCHTQTDTFSNKRSTPDIRDICACGSKKTRSAFQCYKCRACDSVGETKVDYPELSDIIKLINSTGSLVGASRIIGVSDNGLRKHLKRNGVDPRDVNAYVV